MSTPSKEALDHDLIVALQEEAAFTAASNLRQSRACLAAADRLAALREQVAALKAAVSSTEHLLACYRVGRRPSEKALDRKTSADDRCRELGLNLEDA